MGAERGSYRRERRNDAGKVADSLKKKKSGSMFFGASPDQRQDLRQTQDKKSMKIDDLDMNALDRDTYNAPDKVGQNVRLIDIAMGKAPAPGPDAQRIGSEAPGEALPVPTKRRRVRHRSRAGRAVSASMDMALKVQASVSRHLERTAWICAALLIAAGFAALPAAGALIADTGASAGELRAAGWEASTGQGWVAALAWSREIGLVLGGLAVWCALFLRQWRALRSPSRLIELLRMVFLAGLPTATLGAGVLWLAGALPVPWAAPGWILEPLRSLLAPVAGGLPLPLWQAGLGVVAVLSLLVARRRRRRRPLSQAGA